MTIVRCFGSAYDVSELQIYADNCYVLEGRSFLLLEDQSSFGCFLFFFFPMLFVCLLINSRTCGCLFHFLSYVTPRYFNFNMLCLRLLFSAARYLCLRIRKAYASSSARYSADTTRPQYYYRGELWSWQNLRLHHPHFATHQSRCL